MRITIAQINGIVGDLQGNADKIISIINENKGKSDLVVFPELSICGYPPLDLVEQTGFCQEQLQQLWRIIELNLCLPCESLIFNYQFSMNVTVN